MLPSGKNTMISFLPTECNLFFLLLILRMWIECTNCGGKAAFANIMKIKQQHYSSEETLNMLNNLKKETIIATNDRESSEHLLDI